MDLTPEKLVGGGTVLTVAGFFGRWVWDRWWHGKDKKRVADSQAEQQKEARVAALAQQLASFSGRQDVYDTRLNDQARTIGGLESRHNQLDGRLDGLQAFWRSEFTKMVEQIRELEGKIEYKFDNFRMELKGDQQSMEDKLVKLLTGHQERVHDRLNVISNEQAKMLNELMDSFVDRISEPRRTPPKVT